MSIFKRLASLFACRHPAPLKCPFGDDLLHCTCLECGADWVERDEFDIADFDDTGIDLPPNFPTAEDVFRRMQAQDRAAAAPTPGRTPADATREGL